jgi:hypothetical protein
MIEKAARGMRHVKRAARADLHRFKAFIEMAEQETGAWRGVIEDGELVEEHDPSYDEEREYSDIEDFVEDEESEDEDADEESDDESDEGGNGGGRKRTERFKAQAERTQGGESAESDDDESEESGSSRSRSSSSRSRSSGSRSRGSGSGRSKAKPKPQGRRRSTSSS